MCTVNSHTVPKLICISAFKIPSLSWLEQIQRYILYLVFWQDVNKSQASAPAVKARFLCRDSDCFGTVFVVTDALFALSCKVMADCIEELKH